jgi:tetratricopeptide (TPR) repeat protein
MKKIKASKKNLLIVFNIPLTVLLCITLSSCSGEEESSSDPEALFRAAGEAYRNGDPVSARELLMSAAELDPGNPNVWRNLGTVNLDMGRYSDAVTAYQHAIEIDSTKVDVLTDLTGALLGAGRVSEALHTGQLAVQLTPGDGIAFNNYGMALMESGDFEAAAECFNTALRREPENPSVLYNCGRIALMAGNLEEALRFFQESCTADPSFLGPQIEMARTLGMLERHSEAEEQALTVLAMYPGNPEAMNLLALAYSAQNRQSEAIQVLTSLLQNYPEDPGARLGLAECYYRNGSPREALDNYRLFIASLEDTSGTSEIRLRIQELEADSD